MPTPATVPQLAVRLGLAGLVPFVAAAFGAWAGTSEWRDTASFALAAYGAVILSFLGAVHWGFGLHTPENAATASRLVLGVLPALVGWLALLLPATAGLLLLAFGMLATTVAETVAARHGLLPSGYLRLRWLLSFGAGSCLVVGAMALA